MGDIAWITDTKTGEVLPQLGSVALQAGEHAGENIARRIAGKETEPFKYHDKGTMATIGRGAAVDADARRTDDEGQGGIARLGLRPSRAPVRPARIGPRRPGLDWAGFTHERSGRITVET